MDCPDALELALGDVDLGLAVLEARPLSGASQNKVDRWRAALSPEDQALFLSAVGKHPAARTDAEKVIWQRRCDVVGGDWRKHPERERERKAKWRNDPNNRLQQQLLNRFWWATHPNDRQRRGRGTRTRSKIRSAISQSSWTEELEDLVGCSWDQLVGWLELQFGRPENHGMSWDNAALWHIDHHVPVAAFDLNDPEQVKQCFHYTNLRPLWSSENMRKGARVDFVPSLKPREATDEFHPGYSEPEGEKFDSQMRQFPAVPESLARAVVGALLEVRFF